MPLRIGVSSLWGLEGILDQHCKRIKSLRVLHDLAHALIENSSFPILRSLTIYDRGARSVHDPRDLCMHDLHLSTWDAMPALRSLRVGSISVAILPSKTFPALRVLALFKVKQFDYIIQNSYHSLTRLMLDSLYVPNSSETVEFPSLRFLSLFSVLNLKHRMIVPALTTYHEGDIPEEESFPMPLPLLTEYGIFELNIRPSLDATRLHQCYPNVSRVSVRAYVPVVKWFLHSLSGLPTSLPMLRLLAVKNPVEDKDFSREDKASMMDEVFMRNTATSVEMELCFDGRRVPLYFGEVRVYIRECQSKLTTTLRIRMNAIEDLSVILGCGQAAELIEESLNVDCFSN